MQAAEFWKDPDPSFDGAAEENLHVMLRRGAACENLYEFRADFSKANRPLNLLVLDGNMFALFMLYRFWSAY